MYLLYFWHGILKIKHGKMSNNFIPDEGTYPYHTDIPKKPLTVEHGKIWCEDEFNIPYAASMLIDHREKYVKDMQDKWSKDFGFEENKMAAKKKNEGTLIIHEDGTVTELGIFTEAELRYLKEKIRNDIVMYESKKSDTWAGKRYGDMSACEKARIDRNLQMSYDIFDKLLMMGIREDV